MVDDVIQSASGRPAVVIPFRDQAGSPSVGVLTSNGFDVVPQPTATFLWQLSRSASHVVCFGYRDVLDLAAASSAPTPTVYDIRLLTGGDRKLSDVVRENLDDDMVRRITDGDRIFRAHTRAARLTHVDTSRYPVTRLMPPRMVQELMHMRAVATMELFSRSLQGRLGDLGDYAREVWPTVLAVREMELAGIAVDPELARVFLDVAVEHERRPLRQMAQSDGIVRTLFDPVGGKTARLRVEDGFNCMTIPKGRVREVIRSRFPGGEIVSFDYNAIDYRSIVASVDDVDLRSLYVGADDFHSRTCELILRGPVDSLRRDIIKYFTYVHTYGGSDETLREKTRLSLEKVRQVRETMDRKLRSISDFRRNLASHARRDGFVTTPAGGRVSVSADDHDGKILGLYAQTYSSYVFREGLRRAVGQLQGKRSRVIFTVHDELVVDLHPEEGAEVPRIQLLLETSGGDVRYPVKVRRGRNYAEASK